MSKKSKLSLLGLALVAAFALGGFVLLPRPGVPSDDPRAEPVASAVTERAAAPALTVQVARPEVRNWPVEIRASGWIEPWQEVVIATEIGGLRIEAVHAEVGDQVAVGDVLVELSQASTLNQIRQLEAQMQSAQAVLDQAQANADRARTLTGGGALSQQQVAEYLSTEAQAQASFNQVEAQLAAARLDLDNTRVLAVSDGTITSRSAALGGVVAQGEELFRLIRDNRVEWRAEVPLIQLAGVEPGLEVSIPAPDGEAVTGHVRRIAPTASEVNGRVVVYVDLDESAQSLPLRTGMLVSGALRIARTEAVTVPEAAIVMRDGFSYVFTLDETTPTTVTRRRIETGRRRDARAEITGDFPADLRVVQQGGAFLADGTVVRVVGDDAAQQEVGE